MDEEREEDMKALSDRLRQIADDPGMLKSLLIEAQGLYRESQIINEIEFKAVK